MKRSQHDTAHEVGYRRGHRRPDTDRVCSFLAGSAARRPGHRHSCGRMADAGRVPATPVPGDPAPAAGAAPLDRRGRTRPAGMTAARREVPQLATRRGKEPPMAVRRLNHAVLYVHGLQRTVDFYRAALGFEVRLEIPGRAAFLRAPGSSNDHDLGLFEIGTGRAPDQPEHPGLYHLAWEVGTLADLADTRDRKSVV